MLKLPLLLAAAAPVAAAQTNDPAPEAIEASAPRLQEGEIDAMLSDAETVRIEDAGRPHERDHFVHPVTAFNYADDAVITTDVRGTYINHQFPNNDLINEGGARVYDFQGRYAVDERLQVLVSKLGAADVHFGGNEEYGATDVAVGVKYAILQDWENRSHVAVGAGYEFGVGDEDTFGDDSEFRLFGAWTKGTDTLNFNLAANASFATGSESANGDSDRLSLHAHVDYALNDAISPLLELNYYTVLSESDTTVTAISGADLASFGGNEDEDVLTVGLGGEIRAADNLYLRLAYETELTDSESLFGYRYVASAVWTF